MKSFQAKKGFRRVMESKPALILLGMVVIIFTWNVLGFIGKMQETVKNRKMAEEKIVELQKVKTQLSSDIGKLKTEEGIEEDIREKFGLAKEGEGMILIVDDKNTPSSTKDKVSNGFFSFFKNLFK